MTSYMCTSMTGLPPSTQIGYLNVICRISFTAASAWSAYFPRHSVSTYDGTWGAIKHMKAAGMPPEYTVGKLNLPNGTDVSFFRQSVAPILAVGAG